MTTQNTVLTIELSIDKSPGAHALAQSKVELVPMSEIKNL